MKAPGFWWRAPGLAARSLQPTSLIYGAVAARRMRQPGQRAQLPVICIGNVTVGGSGKTPTAIHIASMLRSMGRRPAFLTRGYGGALAGPLVVDPGHHSPREVGDESLLLARDAPTIVSQDRPAGAALAASLAANAIVMDDGLQNPSLEKDLSIAVFDGAVGTGNGLCLPAGPLRAPLSAQWPQIDAVIVIGPGEAGDAVHTKAIRRGLPVFRGELRPAPAAAAALSGRRILAFAGIGRPEKFFATLRQIGAEVVETRAFADHHPYRLGEVAHLLDAARRQNLVPVTTEKDGVRLAALAAAEPRVSEVRELPVSLSLLQADRLGRLLETTLAGR